MWNLILWLKDLNLASSSKRCTKKWGSSLYCRLWWTVYACGLFEMNVKPLDEMRRGSHTLRLSAVFSFKMNERILCPEPRSLSFFILPQSPLLPLSSQWLNDSTLLKPSWWECVEDKQWLSSGSSCSSLLWQKSVLYWHIRWQIKYFGQLSWCKQSTCREKQVKVHWPECYLEPTSSLRSNNDRCLEQKVLVQISNGSTGGHKTLKSHKTILVTSWTGKAANLDYVMSEATLFDSFDVHKVVHWLPNIIRWCTSNMTLQILS